MARRSLVVFPKQPRYIPDFTGAGKDAVTIRHLLTHTSGLRDDLVEAHIRDKLASGAVPPDGRTEPASLALFPPYVVYWRFESGLDAPRWLRHGESSVQCAPEAAADEHLSQTNGTEPNEQVQDFDNPV